MKNGFLPVKKPVGPTSFDVVAKVRRRFGYRKVGHAGTLDPLAEGVLVLGLGRKATRRLGTFLGCDKEYLAEMVLGVTTDSQDSTGVVRERRDCSHVTEEGFRKALEAFDGEYRQTPPMYSALKYRGKPLYRLARRGLEVPRQARTVRIYELELRGFDPPAARVRVKCSKGTYVRTLCADIGERLGCGAHLAGLVRTRVGPFGLEDSLPLEDLLRLTHAELEERLVPVNDEST